MNRKCSFPFFFKIPKTISHSTQKENMQTLYIYHGPFVTEGKRSRDGNSSPSSVIYWTNQSKAYNPMIFSDWLTILRPGWRQVAVHYSASS